MTSNESTHNVFSKEFNKNPYPTYETLRDTEPVYRFLLPDGQYAWMITTYEDAVEALKGLRFSKDMASIMGISKDDESIFTHNMLFADPPDHKRLRGLVQKAFTPRMIEGMRGRIQEITDELLDEAEGKDHMNLIDEFAFPLPIIVICEILGIPKEDREKFRLWSNSMIEGSAGEHSGTWRFICRSSLSILVKSLLKLGKLQDKIYSVNLSFPKKRVTN